MAQPEEIAHLQPLGDLPDRVLHDLPCAQASIPQLVANLAPKPVWVCCAQGVEIKCCFGVHSNAQVVVHGLVLSLQTMYLSAETAYQCCELYSL